MVERAIRYYRAPFKGFRGLTQGGPLLPNLLNIVVDAVFRHWLMILAEEKTGPRVFDHTVQHISELFYSDNRIIVSTQWECIQWEFDVMTGIFEWVGLKTNAKKIVTMVCQPYHITGRHSGVTYLQLITDEGPSHRTCQQ